MDPISHTMVIDELKLNVTHNNNSLCTYSLENKRCNEHLFKIYQTVFIYYII